MADGDFNENDEPLINDLELPLSLDVARAKYGPFLKRNPHSSIDEVALPSKKTIAVKNPWGDESLAISISSSDIALEQTLNNVFLPERYSAIYHIDTRDLEIIWTASPLPRIWEEVSGRKFIFSWSGCDYECEFSTSSDRLIIIAEHFEAVVSSNTSFRNIPSFKNYLNIKKKNEVPPSMEPRSFWIKNINWDDDKILDLANHLNFYLMYYDTVSPFIIVHTPKIENRSFARTRYTAQKFPDKIDARPLDDTLITLWMACHEGDAPKKFLYGFRVIEYASYSYLDSGVRKEIKKILSAPNRHDDINSVTEAISSALQKSKLDDFQNGISFDRSS